MPGGGDLYEGRDKLLIEINVLNLNMQDGWKEGWKLLESHIDS
jgi:hypothetical protein